MGDTAVNICQTTFNTCQNIWGLHPRSQESLLKRSFNWITFMIIRFFCFKWLLWERDALKPLTAGITWFQKHSSSPKTTQQQTHTIVDCKQVLYTTHINTTDHRLAQPRVWPIKAALGKQNAAYRNFAKKFLFRQLRVFHHLDSVGLQHFHALGIHFIADQNFSQSYHHDCVWNGRFERVSSLTSSLLSTLSNSAERQWYMLWHYFYDVRGVIFT